MLLLLFSANYFSIIEQATGMALDVTSESGVTLYSYHGHDTQLWYWEDVDKTILLNKRFNIKLEFTNFAGL